MRTKDLIIAAAIMFTCGMGFGAAIASIEPEPTPHADGGTTQEAVYQLTEEFAGNVYVLDHGLTLSDCVDIMLLNERTSCDRVG